MMAASTSHFDLQVDSETQEVSSWLTLTDTADSALVVSIYDMVAKESRLSVHGGEARGVIKVSSRVRDMARYQ